MELLRLRTVESGHLRAVLQLPRAEPEAASIALGEEPMDLVRSRILPLRFVGHKWRARASIRARGPVAAVAERRGGRGRGRVLAVDG